MMKVHPAIVTAAGTLVAYAFLLGDDALVMAVAGRERLFEDLSALFMLGASGVGFAAWVVARRRPEPSRPASGRVAPAATAYLLLGIFFFVAFGEELSWGQHLVWFRAPESIRSINQQGELNLHNLEIFDSYTHEGRKTGWPALVTSNRLFDYFMVGSFLVLPLAGRHPRAGGWLRALGVPLVSPWMGLPLLLSVVLTIAAEVWLVDGGVMHLAVSETRELSYALLCVAGMWTLLAAERRSLA